MNIKQIIWLESILTLFVLAGILYFIFVLPPLIVAFLSIIALFEMFLIVPFQIRKLYFFIFYILLMVLGIVLVIHSQSFGGDEGFGYWIGAITSIIGSIYLFVFDTVLRFIKKINGQKDKIKNE